MKATLARDGPGHWLALAALLLLAVCGQLEPTGATLFQNIARDMARNRVLHILRHYPDLISEIIQQQQMMQQQQQQQQQQQPQGMSNQQLNGMNQQNGGMNQPFGTNGLNNGRGQMAVQSANGGQLVPFKLPQPPRPQARHPLGAQQLGIII